MEITGTIIIILLAIIFALIAASLLYLCTISGLFYCIEIETKKCEQLSSPTTIAYKFIKGPYKSVGPYFTETCGIAPSCKQLIGLYYDDPATTDEYECRSAIGAILDTSVPNIEDVKKSFLDNGFKFYNLPAVDMAVMTHFPYITFLSIYFAVLRVYPLLNNYIKDKKLEASPCIEIYEGEKIHFIFPLKDNLKFSVTEASDENIHTESCATGEISVPGPKILPVQDKDLKINEDGDSSSSFEQLDPEELSESH